MTTCIRCGHRIDDDQATYPHPDGPQHTALHGCTVAAERARHEFLTQALDEREDHEETP